MKTVKVFSCPDFALLVNLLRFKIGLILPIWLLLLSLLFPLTGHSQQLIDLEAKSFAIIPQIGSFQGKPSFERCLKLQTTEIDNIVSMRGRLRIRTEDVKALYWRSSLQISWMEPLPAKNPGEYIADFELRLERGYMMADSVWFAIGTQAGGDDPQLEMELDGIVQVGIIEGLKASDITMWPSQTGNLVDHLHPKVLLYPNPVVDQVCVRTDSALGIWDRIELVDARGGLLLWTAVLGDETCIDMEGLPNGLYFLRCMRDGRVVNTRKVLKQ